MSEPLFDPADLGTYLGDDSLNIDRAQMIIDDAYAACQSVINPVPESKTFVVRRVAVRAYVGASGQARGYQLEQADADYTGSAPVSGVYLTRWDRQDLLGTETDVAPEAFTIHTRTHPQRPYDAYQLPGRYW